MELIRGLVVEREAQFIGVYQLDEKKVYRGVPRGKVRKSDKIWAGDYVYGTLTEDGIFAIEKREERKNLLVRPKIANVDRVIVVVTLKEPDFQNYLLDNLLVTYAKEGISTVIVFNKIDLLSQEDFDKLKQWEEIYKKVGYDILKVSAVAGEGIGELISYLQGEICVLAGPSGVGKSALLSRITGVELKSGQISRKTKKGKHTSRGVKLIPFGNNSFVGDSPGFSKVEASLWIEKREIKNYFPEFQGYSCRFPDCTHTTEPDCGVKEAVKKGEIACARYKSYLKMQKIFLEELKEWCD